MNTQLRVWWLTSCCLLALLFGWLGPRMDSATANTLPPAVHGLAPLPHGQAVPLQDLPPGATADDGGPSPIIFPPQELSIRFNHRLHVVTLGQACTDCHVKATTSRDSQDLLLPKATACDACHKTDHRDLSAVRNAASELLSQCAYCHIGYQSEFPNRVRRQRLPAPNLKFSHQAHHARNIGCAQCHGEVQNVELATRDQLPRMRGCFGCHQMPEPARGEASGECTACHLTNAAGRMQTQFREGKLEPPHWLYNAGHDADFLERHKFVAGHNSELCSSCHSERFCTDCHDGRVRPRSIHPNDFLTMHAVVARQADSRCGSCHRAQSFCTGCHERVGVSLSGPYANLAGRGRFHPPKTIWTDGVQSQQHHAWEARRNLSACVSCHSEHDCAVCHATREVGGPGAGLAAGVNPHPRGFGQKCRSALRRNARPCLVCHHPQDAKLAQCR